MMQNHNRSAPLICGVLATLLTAFTAVAQMEETPDPSLYERLGGVYNMAAVVDNFLERVLVNDILNANPAILEARDRVPKAGLKFQVTAFLCQATGGPEQYTGRNMKDSHVHLNITEDEWAAFAADFQKTLDQFEVPAQEHAELFALVGSTKADIVTVKEPVPTD